MRTLSPHEINDLRKQHAQRHLYPSWAIRMGWEVEDWTEPAGRRLLTEAEIAEITGGDNG